MLNEMVVRTIESHGTCGVKCARLSSTKSFALSSIVNLWFGHSFDLAVLRQIDMTSIALYFLSKNFGYILSCCLPFAFNFFSFLQGYPLHFIWVQLVYESILLYFPSRTLPIIKACLCRNF